MHACIDSLFPLLPHPLHSLEASVAPSCHLKLALQQNYQDLRKNAITTRIP
ncbi:hypothetical protein [Moorena sp. SIO3I6]|uniref:hypothetical protein n=1 Tax=Moorena sp. SIO3I6 TaxID=2607831 RepID=UPI0013FB233D|nr:hypothetical protein [Moorena sp. SIO3I6]NEP20833.1 hypothetical protein [Moorena sp. SIO3I6]